MNKTLIALVALTGVAAGYTDTSYLAEHTLSSSTEYGDDYRILFAGSSHNNGNEDGSVKLATDGDVTVSSINGSGLTTVNSITYTLNGVFTVTGEYRPTDVASCTYTLNLGNSGSLVANTGAGKSIKCGSMTINAGLNTGETSHSLVTSDYINYTTLTLNITTPNGYKNGGLVFYYANSNAYYSANDVTRATNGNYYSVKNGAEAIELYNDTVYTIAKMNANNTQTASIKNLSLAIGTDPIPEPSTATLSLLALAGLAARRRRK